MRRWARTGIHLRCILMLFWLVPWVALAQERAPDRADGNIVFDGVHIIRPDLNRVLMNQRLWVRDGQIIAIAPARSLDIPTQARRIDASTWYVMPGLYEMHAHIPPSSQGEAVLQRVLSLFLSQGVTTVRGMLGEAAHLSVRNQLAQGERFGPRLITSGPSFSGQSVTGPRQAARRVQDQARQTYDFIKLHPGLGPLEFDAIMQAAERANLPVAGHVSLAVGLTRTLSSQQRSIEHLDGYAQELLAEDSPLRQRDPGFFGIAIAAGLRADRVRSLAMATRRAGVWNVPTQSLLENILGEASVEQLLQRPGMAYMDAATREQWQQAVISLRSEYSPSERLQFLQMRRLLLAALAEEGAGLALGSDAPQIMNVPGFSIHQELQEMVKAGLTPAQALRMGTDQAAAYFGEANRYGRVESGYQADLLFLSADPLQQIEHTQQIVGLMHGGQWYERSDLDARLGELRANLEP